MNCGDEEREVSWELHHVPKSVCSSLCLFETTAGVMHLNAAAAFIAHSTKGQQRGSSCSMLLRDSTSYPCMLYHMKSLWNATAQGFIVCGFYVEVGVI